MYITRYQYFDQSEFPTPLTTFQIFLQKIKLYRETSWRMLTGFDIRQLKPLKNHKSKEPVTHSTEKAFVQPRCAIKLENTSQHTKAAKSSFHDHIVRTEYFDFQ